MEQTETGHEVRTYQIGGRTFTAPPLVARQEKWVWPLVKPLFKKGDTLTPEDIFLITEASLTRLAAIVLVPDGQTQLQKVRAGFEGVEQLDAWFEENASIEALGPVLADFFASGQLWKILRGLAGPLLSQTTGSTTPSASSLTAISAQRNGSGPMYGSGTPDAILSAVGSAAPPSAPSWASAG